MPLRGEKKVKLQRLAILKAYRNLSIHTYNTTLKFKLSYKEKMKTI